MDQTVKSNLIFWSFSIFLVIVLSSCVEQIQAQAWVQKADVGGGVRRHSMAFVIGEKAYVGGGDDGTYWGTLNAPWEYEPEDDAWQIMSGSYAATNRIAGTGFVLGDLLYGMTGYHPGIGEEMYVWYQYSYNPQDCTSTQISEFGAIDRHRSTGFAIGGKGYITCGHTGLWWTPTLLNDLWEYDPLNDQWTQRASLPGPGRAGSAGFVIDDEFFLVGGTIDLDGNNTTETWLYDPISDTWMQKSPIPIAPPYPSMIGVAIGSKGYVCAGNSMWMYDPALDLWQPLTPPPYPFNSSSIAFSVGNKGYFGSGNLGPGMEASNVFYEYDPELDQLTTDVIVAGVDHFRIWPNPIGDRTVTISGMDLSNIAQIKILSLDGRIVFDRSFQSSTGSIELVFPEDISSGTYILQFRSKEKSIEQKIIVL